MHDDMSATRSVVERSVEQLTQAGSLQTLHRIKFSDAFLHLAHFFFIVLYSGTFLGILNYTDFQDFALFSDTLAFQFQVIFATLTLFPSLRIYTHFLPANFAIT